MAELAPPSAFSVASPSDIEQTARGLAAIRETFLATGNAGASMLRALIRESWRRCRALDVDAERDLAKFSIPNDGHLALLRARSAPLLRAAQPVIARLSDKLGDVGYVVALGDAQGSLLEVAGNRERRRRLAGKGLLPGSDWSEAAAGTNAIGTALATGQVVQLLAAEHYCSGWSDLTCTAAPIRDPESGALLGVLDITGDYRLVRPFLGGLIAVAALEVQQELAAQRRSPAAPSRFGGASLPPPARPAAPPPLRQEEYARRADDAERLAAAAGAISASLDLTVTLDSVAAQACQVLALPAAAACLFDDPEGLLVRAWQQRAIAGDRLSAALAGVLRLPTIAAWCEYGAPTMFAELERMPPEIAGLVGPAGVRAVALLPLTTARGSIGALLAARTSAEPWGADDLRLGLAVASQAATALENARMFTELRRYARHSEALGAMATFLGTLLDPSRHLDLILEQIADITDLDAGLMLRCDAPDAPPTIAASHGLPAEGPACAELPSLRSRLIELVAPVARTGEPLLICQQHAPAPSAALLAAAGFCDLVAVPLALSSERIGVLVVGSRGHRQVTSVDLTLFTTIGQQIGLALSNASLRRAASETEALREADRLKSEFLAAVSHDLRSPLTAIRASVEGLLERPGAAPEMDGLLQNIARQAGRLGRFVDQLLDLSCIEAGRLALDREWVELPALIDDLLAAFRQRFPACLVQPAVSPDLPLSYVDPALCAQVLWNLLENAQKYGPREGPVRVEAFSTGDQMIINVADRGRGVEPAERAKIFNHFYRLERDRRSHAPGSGLGLAICRGIVEAHGGRIWVDERPGGGSVFRVALPLAAPGPAEPPDAGLARPPDQGAWP